MTRNLTRPFLTASWQDLLLLNWRVDPRLLQHYLPEGTELDSFYGEHFVSLVGFRFLNMAVKGVPAVGFRDFPEVNLRFYVCRNTGGDGRRGVEFIREMTPHRLVEWVAQRFYNEPYRTLPMRYQIEEQCVSYEWKLDGRWQGMSTQPSGEWNEPPSNSNDTFFIEHYWGYSRQRDGGTLEYEVTHPKWRVRLAKLIRFDPCLAKLYGSEWEEVLSVEPESVVLAEGSEVAVFPGRRI